MTPKPRHESQAEPLARDSKDRFLCFLCSLEDITPLFIKEKGKPISLRRMQLPCPER